jgi:hypothetical protein
MPLLRLRNPLPAQGVQRAPFADRGRLKKVHGIKSLVKLGMDSKGREEGAGLGELFGWLIVLSDPRCLSGWAFASHGPLEK